MMKYNISFKMFLIVLLFASTPLHAKSYTSAASHLYKTNTYLAQYYKNAITTLYYSATYGTTNYTALYRTYRYAKKARDYAFKAYKAAPSKSTTQSKALRAYRYLVKLTDNMYSIYYDEVDKVLTARNNGYNADKFIGYALRSAARRR